MRDPLRLLPILAAAGLTGIISTRICDAMLPEFARVFAVNTEQAATTISFYAIAYGLAQMLYGPLGDRFDKPRVIGIALIWCALSSIAAALAPTLQVLTWARFAMGAGAAALVPMGIAWIGDQVPLSQRQQVLARYSGTTVIGFMIGPLLGGILTQALSWRAAFVLLAVLFGAMALPVLRNSQSTKAAQPDMAAPAQKTPGNTYIGQLRTLFSSPWAWRVYLATCTEGIFTFGCLSFIPTILYHRFDLPLVQGGLMVALFGLGGFCFGRSARWLLQRVAQPHMPGLAGLLLLLAFALYALMPDWIWAAPASVLGGFGFFMMHNTLQLQATQLSEASRGLAVAFFSTSMFIGQSIGAAVGAVVFTRLAHVWGFGIAGIGLCTLGVVLMSAIQSRQKAMAQAPSRLT